MNLASLSILQSCSANSARSGQLSPNPGVGAKCIAGRHGKEAGRTFDKRRSLHSVKGSIRPTYFAIHVIKFCFELVSRMCTPKRFLFLQRGIHLRGQQNMSSSAATRRPSMQAACTQDAAFLGRRQACGRSRAVGSQQTWHIAGQARAADRSAEQSATKVWTRLAVRLAVASRATSKGAGAPCPSKKGHPPVLK